MRAALVTLLVVGCGGFLGAVARYGLSGLVQRQLPATAFPWGTLAVNAVGCLAIGLLAGVVESRQLMTPALRSFTRVGVLGAFTTFSAFGYETVALLRDDKLLPAALNVGSHLLLGLALVWAGYALASAR